MLGIKRGLVLVALFVVSFWGYSQSAGEKFAVYVEMGDSAVVHGNFYGAHVAYRNALELKEDVDVAFKAAEACRTYQNYPAAENFYRIVISKDSVKYPYASYWYSEMLKFQAKYPQASKAFREYYKRHKADRDYFSMKAKHEVKVCSDSVLMVDTIKDIRLHRLDTTVNTDNAELSTSLYRDSVLFFASVRPMPQDSNIYLSKIYKSNRNDTTWTKAEQLEEVINDPYAHVANLTFSRDGKTAYFSKCLLYGDFRCYIYQATYAKEKFYDVKKLPDIINVSGYNTTQPHLAVLPKEEVLFFVSDRPKGRGKKDIWYSRRAADGTFMTPVNCGSGVNSIGDEVTPYYDIRDSLLYFSSEFHNSLGGFDIFKSKGNIGTGKWLKAQNMGKPVNSSYNDLYYTFGKDSVHAFFTSNRTESIRFVDDAYGNDIYTYEIVGKAITKLKDLVPITLYFDNNQPDPNSPDTVSNADYEQLIMDYLARKEEYVKMNMKGEHGDLKEFQRKIVEGFFANDIERGWVKLFLFAELMEIILHDGQDIVVSFKGYASPLASTQYNDKLSKRRISCVQNFFDQFHDGVFNQYLKNTPKTKQGSLKYKQVPIGETKLEGLFTVEGEAINQKDLEDMANRKKSVYSPAAALQRKIEILAVEVEKEKEMEDKIRQEIARSKKTSDDEDLDAEPESNGGLQPVKEDKPKSFDSSNDTEEQKQEAPSTEDATNNQSNF